MSILYCLSDFVIQSAVEIVEQLNQQLFLDITLPTLENGIENQFSISAIHDV